MTKLNTTKVNDVKTKKLISLLLSFIMLVSAVPLTCINAFAAGISVNATTVELYVLDDSYTEISIPSTLNQSFQLKVTGASTVKYKVISGRSATVDDNGLIKPAFETTYWYGNIGYSSPVSGQTPTSVDVSPITGSSVVRVTADSETFKVSVNVNSYAQKYADDMIDNFVKTSLKSTMTDYQKVVEIAKFVSSNSYSYKYQSYVSLFVHGEGDCWAFTNGVVAVAKKAGFDAWARNGNQDPGAGSGHRNAMVKTTDSKYYQVETSYGNGDYDVTERKSLFSYRLIASGKAEVFQYDGKSYPETMEVPAAIDGKTVVSLGKSFIAGSTAVKKLVLPSCLQTIGEYAFSSCTNLESVNLPKSLETIGQGAFTKCKNAEIKNESSNFCVLDGIVYNASATELVAAPKPDCVTIRQGVKKIDAYAFYYNTGAVDITIPSSVTEMGEGVFANCSSLKTVTVNGSSLKTLDKYVFAGCSKLASVKLPASVSSMAEDVFHSSKNVEVFSRSATVKDYCSTNNISINTHHPGTAKDENVVPATCQQKGSYDSVVCCSVCGEELERTSVVTEMTDHNAVIDPAVPATCISTGKTQGKHCSECGKVIVAQQTVPKGSHTPAKAVKENVVNATCSRKGHYDNVVYCSVCGDELERTTVETDKLNHTVVIDPAVPATCTENGKTQGSHCSKCGEVIVQQKETKAYGHDFGANSKYCYYCDALNPDYQEEEESETEWGCYYDEDYGWIYYDSSQFNYPETEKGTNADKRPAAKKKANTVLSVPAIMNVKRGKKRFTVSWLKVKGVDGYEIQYATKKNMKKAVTRKAKASKSKLTVKKLKKGKKYFVRVRAYKTVNGKKQYSTWSAVKKVKIK